MKINKINKEFLDLYYKGKTIAFELDEETGKVYLTDTYRLYIINFEDFVFRFDLFRHVSLKQLVNEDGYEKAEITNGLIETETIKEKITIRVIKNDLYTINVNNKFLNYFDNPQVKIKNEYSPVLIYENDNLVGLILPIKEY